MSICVFYRERSARVSTFDGERVKVGDSGWARCYPGLCVWSWENLQRPMPQQLARPNREDASVKAGPAVTQHGWPGLTEGTRLLGRLLVWGRPYPLLGRGQLRNIS